MRTTRGITATAVAGIFLLGAACSKKVAVGPPPPPPPPVSSQAASAAVPPASRPAPVRQAEPAKKSLYPDAATRAKIEELLARIQDAYFDYDRHSLRPDAQKALVDDAQTLGDILRNYPAYKLTVEGHCDERGSAEYNLALGDARASAAKEYLTNLGIPGEQLRTVSYGKERPQCSEHEENCWQRNRRAHVVAMAVPQS